MKQSADLLTLSNKMLNLVEQLHVVLQQLDKMIALASLSACQMFSVPGFLSAQQTKRFGRPLIRAALFFVLLGLISFSQWHLVCVENRSCSCVTLKGRDGGKRSAEALAAESGVVTLEISILKASQPLHRGCNG